MSKGEREFSLAGIRDGIERIARHAAGKRLRHWDVHLEAMPKALAAVRKVFSVQYGSLEKIPWHSRWVHLRVCPEAMQRSLERRFEGKDRLAAKLELVTLSVLLDAGAGATWRYRDEESAKMFSRSEGLAVASVALFLSRAGEISAESLTGLTQREFDEVFQITEHNPLAGRRDRLELLQRLGSLVGKSERRLGDWLLQKIEQKPGAKTVSMETLANGLIAALAPLWPKADIGRLEHERYPFHKLILWLSYSLGETFALEGARVTDVEKMPGLAEYRNGGLFIDSGVLTPQDANATGRAHPADEGLIVEWRALTLWLLEKLAEEWRRELGASAVELPMAKVLQAGTWAAGRALADEKRGGEPPLSVDTKGILF